MSSRIFQGVIVQMKDATTRCIGVVDEQGFVIACSELSMIGSRLDDFQAAVGEVQEQLFSTDARTYKILSASTARKLYVHRNTLVYRLEKVKKITGLDLREFEDAILFKVAVMVKKYLDSQNTAKF